MTTDADVVQPIRKGMGNSVVFLHLSAAPVLNTNGQQQTMSESHSMVKAKHAIATHTIYPITLN